MNDLSVQSLMVDWAKSKGFSCTVTTYGDIYLHFDIFVGFAVLGCQKIPCLGLTIANFPAIRTDYWTLRSWDNIFDARRNWYQYLDFNLCNINVFDEVYQTLQSAIWRYADSIEKWIKQYHAKTGKYPIENMEGR